MSIYLNERQVGFDTATVGFPDIGDCMGLVIQVDGGLFGFHIMPREENKVAAFLQYFTGHLSTGAMRHLHGCCRWTNRYGSTGTRTDWEAEMTDIAQRLGYHGPVSGFNAASGTKLVSGEAVYIEVRKLGTAPVSYHYKRSGKMAYTKANVDSDSDHLRGIVPDSKSSHGFGLTTKLLFGNTSVATVVPTSSNKGELHKVKGKKVVTFDVP